MMKKYLLSLVTIILTVTMLATSASAAPRDEAEPGEAYNIVYYEEFNYPNTTGNAEVAKLLGWKELSKSAKNAVTNPTASYAIRDGQLYVVNNKSGAADSYIKILDDAHMMSTWLSDYTVQFDVTLTAAGNNSRYIAILTDYKDSTAGFYHSFHLRINGSANSQARMSGKWSNFDAPGDYYAADQDDTDGTSSIAKKILGKDFDGSQVLKDVSLTIRIVCEKLDVGPRVYIRNNTDGGHFVLVSRAGGEEFSNGAWRKTGGMSLVLKAGGAVTGYVDNILVYKGDGEPCWEEIKVPETTEAPETTAEPETEPVTEPITEPVTEPVTAPIPEETGCASALTASGAIITAIAAAFVLRKRK